MQPEKFVLHLLEEVERSSSVFVILNLIKIRRQLFTSNNHFSPFLILIFYWKVNTSYYKGVRENFYIRPHNTLLSRSSSLDHFSLIVNYASFTLRHSFWDQKAKETSWLLFYNCFLNENELKLPLTRNSARVDGAYLTVAVTLIFLSPDCLDLIWFKNNEISNKKLTTEN